MVLKCQTSLSLIFSRAIRYSPTLYARNSDNLPVGYKEWNGYKGRGGRYSVHYINPQTDPSVIKRMPEEVRKRSVKAAFVDSPVSVYSDKQVQRFINILMDGGNKSLVRSIFEQALFEIKCRQFEKYRKAEDDESRSKIVLDPLAVFHSALENGAPQIGVYSEWRLGTFHKVPVPLSDKTRYFKVFKWLKDSATVNPTKRTPFSIRLANHIIDMHNNEGDVIEKKIALYKIAEQNKAYVRLRKKGTL